MTDLSQFKIIPVLGTKTNVIASDESLFKFIKENVALTHDVGGVNFDITMKTNACTKAKGYVQWSNRPCVQNLAYDAQTGSFSVGNTITGATSGTTAIILAVSEDGTSGTLTLKDVSGIFYDNEIIYESALGSEIFSDGDMSVPESWTISANWSIAGGVATKAATGGGYLYQTETLTVGSFYKIVHTLSNYSTGIFRAYIGGAAPTFGTSRTEDGTFTDYLQMPNTTQQQGFHGDASSSGNLDDASIKKVTNAALCNGTLVGTATKCLGLYELSVAGTRDHIFFDNGKCFIFDSSLNPQAMEDADSTTFASDNTDLYSICTVGEYMVFADRAEHTPYKWKHGDTLLTKLIASGTAYKFRYVLPFQRRVLGLYSGETNGDIDIRWSTSWPGTAIASLNFPATNQLYVPNDDSITGGALMGHDRCYIYCQNSIQQLVYYADYEAPFRCYTTVQKQGCECHHSIVNLGDRHYLFNRNYGFCEYRGGNTFPYGGIAISDDIEDIIQNISADYYNLIVGTFIPLTKEVVWTVPLDASSTPSHLLFYNIETNQWRIEDKSMRYVDEWRLVENFTWNDLITEAGGAGSYWAGVQSNPWAYYCSVYQRLVYANTNGHLYNRDGDDLAGANMDGYRIEPAMHFGTEFEKKFLQEIWFGIALSGDFNIYVYHRSGDTMGELVDESWTSLGEISCNNNPRPVLHCGKTARLHQIKWGTDLKDERFRVTEIAFKYKIGSNI